MLYSKELRKKAGLTQQRLADLTGLSQNHITQVESGKRSISEASDRMLVNVCNKIIADFVEANATKTNGVKPSFSNTQTIPVVAMASAAHFDPTLSNLCDLWECTEERVACACAHADELFGVRISGDSMAPALLDGDIVAVSDKLPGTGDMCIVLHRTDGILCKRWFWRQGVVRLDSINPEGRSYRWTKEEFAAEQPLTWRFKVEALIYRKL